MKRARLIIKELYIQKQGEVHFFQMRLPRNAVRIIGVETDAFMLSAYTIPVESSGVNPDGTISSVNRTPFLKWREKENPVLGKLKLQSLDRNGIFFENWLTLITYKAGLPDMIGGLFPKNPHTLNNNLQLRSLNISCSNLLLNGLFEDAIGKKENRDLNYKLKVLLWVEINEEANGLKYDFQQEEDNHSLELKS